MRILLAMNGDAGLSRWIEAFRKALPEAEVSTWQADGPALGADVAIVWHPPAELFVRETGLRAVFNLGAGVDGLLKIPTLPSTLPVIRLEDAGMTVQMAEYALHALWEASRSFASYRQAQGEHEWRMLPVTRRHEWPVGVLGMGKVGARVAQAVAEFEYPVAGWSRGGHGLPGIEDFAGAQALDAFLARTRVLINALPLTPDTRDILNRDTFAKLLPGAYVVNVGRGEHLVEEDLLAALASGHVAGATLDVFRTEPLPQEHPFWSHPAITITPHTAARTLRTESVKQIADKIRQLAKGESVSGVVDRPRGY
ncbi:glyoxylate/hydroxypyruvate reductase A [Verticiella sediminum]|uniref:Glyoxylate/hydroxypyruvate reductase A n=1 Tax=Verticiella sediminum TaxID=1247510 RepID=A0A556AMQ7_9BURK|nr:glyoxylate/hydroxypyruvate reductase A [Verticiella sediminum]TSH94172.1 glyoxylate/hydroxypyruvate reductase A [Verticiella sediminum]